MCPLHTTMFEKEEKFLQLSTKGRVILLFILLTLALILTGKLFFTNHNENIYLFSYGIIVTAGVLAVFGITFTFYKDPYYSAKRKLSREPQRDILVSCIVAVKNDENIIGRCIDSFLRQTYEKKEIIVVDDGSTDNTPLILKEYADKQQIKLLTLAANVGKKKALAQGILAAEGEIFAFSDSDSVLATDALEKITTIFEAYPLVGAVSGHCRALNADENILTKMQDSWYEGQFAVRKAFESIFGSVTCVSGPLAVFRKSAIYNFIPAWEHDNFLGQEFLFATDRTLTGFVLGSKYIGKKLKRKYANSPFVQNIDYPLQNWKIVYCKSAKVWTHIPDTFKKMITQQVRWKKSFIRNIFFTGLFYWRKPLLPALLYYFHVMFVVLGPLIVLRHLLFLPLRGNVITGILYMMGILFIGFCYALAYRFENSDHKWVYRPLMSLFSTLVLSFLLYYSLLTIRRNIWTRG